MQTLNNLTQPLLHPGFKPGDRWSMVNTIRGGATLGTCGKHPARYDPRPYGIALMETGYPALSRLCQGEWSEAEQADCLHLLQTATARGSYPMSTVGLLVLQQHPMERRELMWSKLTPKEQAKLRLHLELAKGDPDLKALFV